MRAAKSDITLEMECFVDDLSPAQMAAYEKVANEHNAIKNSLKRALSTNDGKELFNGQVFQAYSFKGKVLQELKEATLPKKPPKEASTEVTGTRSGRKRPTNSNFVYLESSSEDEDEDLPLAKRLAVAQTKKGATSAATPGPSRKSALNSSSAKTGKNSPLPVKNAKSTSKPAKTDPHPAKGAGSGAGGASGGTTNESSDVFRPSEISSVGGLVIGSDKDTKDNTKDNKLHGKTFPSLVVLAKPWLKVKDMSSTRSKLDSKVKLVLMLTPNKLTEWFLQEGLLKTEQKCSNHRNNGLKLGVYSDASKFPFTGGYVWISECCPTRFVSVFYGSIFEGAPHPPACILKLIYHWSCQTNIQNVVQWVKVDNVYIKGVYTWLRTICTLAVHQKLKKLGGPDKYVEVGVISLGTTSQDGAQRQVKVEVLGIYDYTEKIIRLCAVEPISDADRNYKRRFQTILEPLQRWAHKDSIIAIDLTIDKSTIHQMGFKNVVQASAIDSNSKHTNATVMDYLRRIVPRMFQNTLSLLSRQMIQQFLDELVWREQYGTYALQAFNHITMHIAEQTRLNTNETLTQRLYQVATNPFKDWSILPANARETPANTAPKRLKTLINDADYTQPKQVEKKSEKKGKHDVDKRGKDKDKESTLNTTRGSKQRGKHQVEEVSPSPAKKQGKSGGNVTTIKNTPKGAASKQAVEAKINKKAPVNVKLVKKEKEEEPLKGLEELYYGVLDGFDDYYENFPSNSDVSVQLNCPICPSSETCSTNTQLQKHLYSHIDVSSDMKEGQGEWKQQCQYCLQKFNEHAQLEVHHQTAHLSLTRGKESGKNSYYNCLICQVLCNGLQSLTSHMQKTHNILELPFSCQACGYRTSIHRDIVRHFNEDHHQHNFLQCPFCLDIFHFSYKGELNTKHIEIYLMHLRQHAFKLQQKTHISCQKCVLNFTDKGALKMHIYYHHISGSKNTNKIRPLLESSLEIPLPKVRSHHREQLLFGVHEKLGEFFAFIEGSICGECNCEVISEEHYPSLMKCNKCHYKTCCERAMFAHTANCNGETESNSAMEMPLSNEMHCVCGFSTDVGNKMADHLATCGQKSAYPTLEVAVENTVKRNMLDMLGLVRRDGESGNESSDAQKAIDAETEDALPTTTENPTGIETTPTTINTTTTATDTTTTTATDTTTTATDTTTTTAGESQEPIPFGDLEAAPIADDDDDVMAADNDQTFDSTISGEEESQYQTQLGFVAPQHQLGGADIDLPLIGDLADPNPTTTPAQYLGEVHTPMFDAIADAEQQHYQQLIQDAPSDERQ